MQKAQTQHRLNASKDCLFSAFPFLNKKKKYGRRQKEEKRTSSWIFLRKAISSCSVSMRLSRSRRARVAASTSCNSLSRFRNTSRSTFSKHIVLIGRRRVTHRPESCKVVFCVLFLEDFFLESDRRETSTHQRGRFCLSRQLSSNKNKPKEKEIEKSLKRHFVWREDTLGPCKVS